MLRDIEKDLGFADALAKESSQITIRVDSRRFGKSVTVLAGFDPAIDLDAVGKELKRHLGTGGTVKDGRIELQGDHVPAVRKWLAAQGYAIA